MRTTITSSRIKTVWNCGVECYLVRISRSGMLNLARLCDDTGISSSVYYLSRNAYRDFVSDALNVHCLYSWEGMDGPWELIPRALCACEPALATEDINWRRAINWTDGAWNGDILLEVDETLPEAPQLASLSDAAEQVACASACASTADKFLLDVQEIFARTALARTLGVRLDVIFDGLQVAGRPLRGIGERDNMYGHACLLRKLGLGD